MLKVWKLGALALGSSLFIAVPAFATEQEGTAQAQEEQAQEAAVETNDSDRICRRVRTTGTRLTQRICMTRAEWASMREEAQETLRDNQMDSGANTRTAGSN